MPGDASRKNLEKARAQLDKQREQLKELNGSKLESVPRSEDVFIPSDEAPEPVIAGSEVVAKEVKPEVKVDSEETPAKKKRMRKVVYEEYDSDDESLYAASEWSTKEVPEPEYHIEQKVPEPKAAPKTQKLTTKRSRTNGRKRVTKAEMEKIIEEQLRKQFASFRKDVRNDVQTYRTDLAVNRASDFFRV